MEPDMLKEKKFLLAHDSECLEDQDWTATSGQNLMLLQLMMEKQKRNESWVLMIMNLFLYEK